VRRLTDQVGRQQAEVERLKRLAERDDRQSQLAADGPASARQNDRGQATLAG